MKFNYNLFCRDSVECDTFKQFQFKQLLLLTDKRNINVVFVNNAANPISCIWINVPFS